MPANYIFTAMFCRSNTEYIVICNRASFPSDTTFSDFDKLGTNDNPIDLDFEKAKIE